MNFSKIRFKKLSTSKLLRKFLHFNFSRFMKLKFSVLKGDGYICLCLLFCSSLLLQSCAPLLAGAAGGSLVNDNRSFKETLTDRNITYQAQNALDENPELKQQAHLSIATLNGVVLIVGQAPSKDMEKEAIKLIQTVPQVSRIYNEINIAEPTDAKQRLHDSWITTKVHSAMLVESGLHSALIKVITENSVVYLLGLTSHTQADLAAQVASKIGGVQKVVKLVQYVH